MGIENQPLRQLEGDHEPITLHEVDGDTARDTYHVPGRPLDREPAGEVPEPVVLEHNEDPVWATGVDSRSADHAYASKGNIVQAPEHEPTVTPPDGPTQVDAVVRGPELDADGNEVVEPEPEAEEPADE